MSTDEEDYMSDAFLQKCGDTRPGLASKEAQRRHGIEQAQKQSNKSNAVIPKHKLEATQREAGLKASISSDSKGFALLQKMGYKPGMGIGKHGTGQVEPVPIELKTGRSGLGKDTEMKRRAIEMNNMRAMMAAKRKKADESCKKTFMDKLKDRFSNRNIDRDLNIAQKACLQLDQQQGIINPGETFFWPANSLPSVNEPEEAEGFDGESLPGVEKKSVSYNYEEDSDDDYNGGDDNFDPGFSNFEKLDILTRYLRNTYCYCMWCGTQYNDKADLETNCPGNTEEAHC